MDAAAESLSMSELTAKDLQWFHMANAAAPAPSLWSGEFYQFKDRFLRRFAKPAGWDQQTIEKECWTCGGSGMFTPHEKCRSCDGSGIYRSATIWLSRWDLEGHIYHKPNDPPPFLVDPVHEIEGRIKHPEVPASVGYRSFLRLLIRHEPVTFYHHAIGRVQRRIGFHWRTVWLWRLIRIRNKLDLFPAVNDDDVPF